MEDTLRVATKAITDFGIGLNPCFNGRYSQRDVKNVIAQYNEVLILVLMEDTLREKRAYDLMNKIAVLILVLMEDTLRVQTIIKNNTPVLILVLMEDTLRANIKSEKIFQKSLNPCFNGRYSQSMLYVSKKQ